MDRDHLRQQVECPVCMEQFRTPKLLPCQHSLCLQCLQTIFEMNGRRQLIICPECQQPHQIPPNGITGFPTSVTIQRLIEVVNRPATPHLTETAIHQDEVLSRAIVMVEQQQILERENTGQQRRVMNRTQIQNQDVHVSNVQDNTTPSTFQSVRQAYLRYLGHLLRNEDRAMTCVLFESVKTISRFIAGAVKLGSECHDEHNVAMYSFVKAWFGLLLYGTLLGLRCTTGIDKAVKNKFVQMWYISLALFTIIWFFIGTVWVFGYYAEMKEQCPKFVEDWNFHFINFILALTVLDWISAVIFAFYSLYYLCGNDDDNDGNNSVNADMDNIRNRY